MAGRVLRTSDGRFNGSTKGWRARAATRLRKMARGPVAKPNQTKSQIVTHTVKRSTFAGVRGVARSAGRAAWTGVKGSLIPAIGVVGVSLAAGKRYGISGRAMLPTALKAGAATVGVGALASVVQNTRPLQSFRASAIASAETGMANRAAGALRGKTGISKRESYRRVYRGGWSIKRAIHLGAGRA